MTIPITRFGVPFLLRQEQGQPQAERAATANGTQLATGVKSPSDQAKPVSASQAAMTKRADALASEVRALLAKSGLHLEGALAFTVAADGAVVMSGSGKDRASLEAILKSDRSHPSLTKRLMSLTKDSQAVAVAMHERSNILRAARASPNPSALIALYTSFVKEGAQTARATVSISPHSGWVTYSGSMQVVA